LDWEPTVGDSVRVPARTVNHGMIVGIHSDQAGFVYRVKPASKNLGSGEPSWRGTMVTCRREEMRRVD
jgi:hypothetical protein